MNCEAEIRDGTIFCKECTTTFFKAEAYLNKCPKARELDVGSLDDALSILFEDARAIWDSNTKLNDKGVLYIEDDYTLEEYCNVVNTISRLLKLKRELKES